MEHGPPAEPADQSAVDAEGDPGVDASSETTGDEEAPSAPQPELDVFGRAPKGRTDWSHRKAEPRMFALLWTLYLMASTGVMFVAVAPAMVITPETARPAARVMLVLVAVGMGVLWPALRLAQAAPRRPLPSVLKDLVVVLLPVQAIVWPLALSRLAGYPLPVVSAIALGFIAWGGLVGGLMLFAMSSIGERTPVLRMTWALAFIALLLIGPIAGLGTDPRPDPTAAETVWLLSPATGVLELTRPREASGLPARVLPEHWRMLWLIAAAGVGVMLLAIPAAVARRRPAA